MPIEQLTWQVQDDPGGSEKAVVDAGLDRSNHASAPLSGVRPLGCFAQTAAGTVVGGAVGRTWGECCELQQLWVAPAHRRSGVASRLVRLFESRAAERGCRVFYLETFSFQAPDLYHRCGYNTAVDIRGFPDGIAKYVMLKETSVRVDTIEDAEATSSGGREAVRGAGPDR